MDGGGVGGCLEEEMNGVVYGDHCNILPLCSHGQYCLSFTFEELTNICYYEMAMSLPN